MRCSMMYDLDDDHDFCQEYTVRPLKLFDLPFSPIKKNGNDIPTTHVTELFYLSNGASLETFAEESNIPSVALSKLSLADLIFFAGEAMDVSVHGTEVRDSLRKRIHTQKIAAFGLLPAGKAFSPVRLSPGYKMRRGDPTLPQFMRDAQLASNPLRIAYVSSDQEPMMAISKLTQNLSTYCARGSSWYAHELARHFGHEQ